MTCAPPPLNIYYQKQNDYERNRITTAGDKIFRIEKMRQDAWMKKYAGNFVGTIVFDRRQSDVSKSMRIVLSNGTVVGYAPVSMLGELIIFVKHQDVSACKGHINAEYDRLKKQYYFWGECVVPKP